MDRNKFRFMTIVIVCFSWLFINCTKTIENKVAAAQDALDVAKGAGATIYAKGEFSCAQDLYYVAFNDIQDEKRRLFLLRNYNHASRELDSVICFAEKAAKTAEMAKFRIDAEKKLAVERENSFKAKYLEKESTAICQKSKEKRQ